MPQDTRVPGPQQLTDPNTTGVALFYTPNPKEVPNAFAEYWANYMMQRTPWTRQVFTARLAQLDPAARDAAMLKAQKLKNDLLIRQAMDEQQLLNRAAQERMSEQATARARISAAATLGAATIGAHSRESVAEFQGGIDLQKAGALDRGAPALESFQARANAAQRMIAGGRKDEGEVAWDQAVSELRKDAAALQDPVQEAGLFNRVNEQVFGNMLLQNPTDQSILIERAQIPYQPLPVPKMQRTGGGSSRGTRALDRLEEATETTDLPEEATFQGKMRREGGQGRKARRPGPWDPFARRGAQGPPSRPSPAAEPDSPSGPAAGGGDSARSPAARQDEQPPPKGQAAGSTPAGATGAMQDQRAYLDDLMQRQQSRADSDPYGQLGDPYSKIPSSADLQDGPWTPAAAIGRLTPQERERFGRFMDRRGRRAERRGGGAEAEAPPAPDAEPSLGQRYGFDYPERNALAGPPEPEAPAPRRRSAPAPDPGPRMEPANYEGNADIPWQGPENPNIPDEGPVNPNEDQDDPEGGRSGAGILQRLLEATPVGAAVKVGREAMASDKPLLQQAYEGFSPGALTRKAVSAIAEGPEGIGRRDMGENAKLASEKVFGGATGAVEAPIAKGKEILDRLHGSAVDSARVMTRAHENAQGRKEDGAMGAAGRAKAASASAAAQSNASTAERKLEERKAQAKEDVAERAPDRVSSEMTAKELEELLRRKRAGQPQSPG